MPASVSKKLMVERPSSVFFTSDGKSSVLSEATQSVPPEKFSELVVVASGQGTRRVDGKAELLHAGDAFVLPAGSSDDVQSGPDLSLMRVAFDAETAAASVADLKAIPGYLALFKFEPRLRALHGLTGRLRLSPEELRATIEVLGKLELELDDKKPGFENVTDSLFCALSVQLARSYANMRLPLCEALVRLSPVLLWLDQHFEGPVTLEDVVAKAEMSQSTLQRSFKRCFDVSPFNYLLHLRMQKAQLLLRDTEAKVKEIAPSVGIDDANYFARLFRQHTGMEPTAYRARSRITHVAPEQRSA